MKYTETKPCSELQAYIHCFWELTGGDNDKKWERNFPDGCSGLVMNLGNTCITDNGAVRMDFGKTYAVGTMTSYKDSFIEGDTRLFGVCLKPATFANFYNFIPQNQLTDQTIQLEQSKSFNIAKLTNRPIEYLNTFFACRLNTQNELLMSVINDINQSHGQLSILEIAKKNFVTVRWVERNFQMFIGLTPKQYSNIVRFQRVLSKINNSTNKQSLLDIAIDCGFYDHSHLTNEIRKNTGLAPSQL